jgi:hypothetical protein
MPTFYAGFDMASYPSDEIMQSLRSNTSLVWCGFYLYPATDWIPHYTTIKQMGWGVAPIYIGKQPYGAKLQLINSQYSGHQDQLKLALYNNGKEDGVEAVMRAVAAKIPTGSVIYFDVEAYANDPIWFEYYRGWCRAVVDHFYSVGLYTKSWHASWIMQQLFQMKSFDICMPYVWISDYTRYNQNAHSVPASDYLTDPLPTPNPSSGWSGASNWQHLGNFGLKWSEASTGGASRHRQIAPVDFNSSIFRDPGLGILSTV